MKNPSDLIGLARQIEAVSVDLLSYKLKQIQLIKIKNSNFIRSCESWLELTNQILSLAVLANQESMLSNVGQLTVRQWRDASSNKSVHIHISRILAALENLDIQQTNER